MKTALLLGNLANAFHRTFARHWPELAADPIDGVWFTGSRVWVALYPMLPVREPPLERDWDIFVTDEAIAALVCDRLGLAAMPACRTQDKRHGAPRVVSSGHVPTMPPSWDEDGDEDEESPHGGYEDGWSYATPRGVVDLWISRPGNVFAELRTYPESSHAHCRAAFSFTDGLVVLPNDRAVIATQDLAF